MMVQINHLVIFVFVFLSVNEAAEANVRRRTRRQSGDGNGEIIDNIFNIPITAIKQTAAAAQSIYPDGGSSIDSVFNIPVATLEAVSNLVKNRNSQRRQMDAAEAQKRRKDRKDRLQAHRKGQRLQHNDPLGVNALTNLLVGNHGLFGGHGSWGGLHLSSLGDHFSSNLGSHLISHFGGSHGDSHGDGADIDDHDSVGDYQDGSTSSSSDNNGYEVTEDVDEDRSGWGSWFNFSNFFGDSSNNKPKNKIAPRPDRRKYGRYDDQDAPLENKVAPKNNYRNDYRRNRSERPLENKIAPKNDRLYYQNNYSDQPRRDGRSRDRNSRDRLLFEHRSI